MISHQRLTVMFGISLLLHATAATLLGQNAWSAAIPGGFDKLEVRLVDAAPPWPVSSAHAPHHREPAAPSGNSATNGTQPDPIVEARHDVTSLNNPKPAYPLSARRRGLEGRVLIAARVRADGHCAEARVRQSSGYTVLDESARESVQRWRFVPARRGGTPVDSWVEVPILFQLGS